VAAVERLNPDGALARALAANRERANGLVRQACHANPRFDAARFAEFVCGPLDRLAVACAGVAPACSEAVALALYEVAVDLFAHDLLGADAPVTAVALACDVLAPAASRLVAEDPRAMLASVANLVTNLERQRPGSAARWVREAVPVAAACDRLRTFLEAALVVAWRCGLPQYRESALDRWRGLPEPVRRAALGLDAAGAVPPLADVEAALKDPWWMPRAGQAPAEIRIVARVGGFSGLGGPFIRPPRVACAGGALFAFDRGSCWRVHADGFGASLTGASDGVPAARDQAPGALTIDRHGVVRRSPAAREFSELRDAASFAATEWTLAVTLRHSHLVYLVASAAATGSMALETPGS
jgi:hypothetical protein